jgi:hypothetical protein
LGSPACATASHASAIPVSSEHLIMPSCRKRLDRASGNSQ